MIKNIAKFFRELFCEHEWQLIETLDTPEHLKTLTVMDWYTCVSKCSRCGKRKEHN